MNLFLFLKILKKCEAPTARGGVFRDKKGEFYVFDSMGVCWEVRFPLCGEFFGLMIIVDLLTKSHNSLFTHLFNLSPTFNSFTHSLNFVGCR